jgi:hypothetical protein
MKNLLLTKSAAILIIIGSIILGCKKEVALEEAALKNESVESAVSAKLSSKSLLGSPAACGPVLANNGISKTTSSTQRVVSNANTIYDTDFVSAGLGGLRGVGSGTITVPGSFSLGTVTRAYLYWHGISNSPSGAGQSIQVNSTAVTGVKLGVSSDNCWGYANSQAYRADVTSLVRSSSGRSFELDEFDDLNPNGASILVFYSDGNGTNNRDVVLFEGNDSNQQFSGFPDDPDAPADPTGWDVTLSGINYNSGAANVELHVADGQPFSDGPVVVNGTTVLPAGPNFDGNTVPGGALWDKKTFDVTSFLNPGPNTLSLTSSINGDCLSLILAIIDLPKGTAPPSKNIKVPFDIKPQECPNEFICSDKGLVTVGILGTSTLNVSQIDKASIRINGIMPKESWIKDVTAPFTGNVKDCKTCTIAKPDGDKDLMFKFDIQQVGKSLGKVKLNQCIKITITGKMLEAHGSGEITGEDFILIKNPKR